MLQRDLDRSEGRPAPQTRVGAHTLCEHSLHAMLASPRAPLMVEHRCPGGPHNVAPLPSPVSSSQMNSASACVGASPGGSAVARRGSERATNAARK